MNHIVKIRRVAHQALAVALLLSLASCGDSSSNNFGGGDSAEEERASIRDSRYCEITPLYLGPDGITSDTWNTSDLNDCPAEDWEALDFGAIREELGAITVRKNGPRHWLMDAGQLHGREDAERRFFGNLEFRLVAHVQHNFTPPPPGEFLFEVTVERDTEFLFYENRPVYELLAPLGKRYVMQSYAQIEDPTLTLADLDSIGPRIGLPEGWEYRVSELSEDLLVEDFQGYASVVGDALKNTYQRAEALEYLTDGQVTVELFNADTRQSWAALMSEQTAEQVQVELPWQKSDQIIAADKSVYSQSPDAELDGRFEQMTQAANTFSHSASNLCEPELHSSGLIVTNQSRRFQELTYSAGRTIPYIVNHLGENFVLVSNSPGTAHFHNSLPSGWSQGEVQLTDDWRVVFEGVVNTVEIVDGTKIYRGPVLLPGEVVPVPPAQTFTHKMIKPTGENPFAQLAYECFQCTFEQQAAIEPPPGWSRGVTQIVLAVGELRSTPCGVPSSVDFIPEIPGNEYQLIARPLDGRLLEVGAQGLMILIDVMRDTVLRFPAGQRIHELTNPEGDVYVMFAYEAESMDVNISDFNSPHALDGYPRPTGWSYSTRILERELVLDSTGVVSVLAFRGSAPLSTWEKR